MTIDNHIDVESHIRHRCRMVRNSHIRCTDKRSRRSYKAHIRHTLEVAEEQVEAVVEIDDTDPRTATPVKRYSFEGIWYATRDEAERMRAEKIGEIARGFYRDLPAALAARRRDGRLS